MRTQMMIMLIVTVIMAAGVAVALTLMMWLGWVPGLAISVTGLLLIGILYVSLIKPWHMRWGATDSEVAMAMPGDELIPGAGSATRAITIATSQDEVWPWLIQLGYGRAGWYSYDWIDNDFKPSANSILPEYQSLVAGDRILMMPTMGFDVRSIDEPNSIVSVLQDGSTSWCLGLYPDDEGGTRLISRWRPKFEKSLATFLMTTLSEPGTFIMEQKMLRTIRDRAEAR